MTAEQLQKRLEREKAKLAAFQKQADAIQARYDNRHWTELDSATGSGIRRKPSHKSDEQRFGRYDREAEVSIELEQQAELVRVLERRLTDARNGETRKRYTREDVVGAKAVKNQYGWHKVARVNKTTVSVETGYSWTDRIAFDAVLEVRK